MTTDTHVDASIDAFINALPKVELHVHLVGSASVATVLELSRRHPGSAVPTTEEELRAFYHFVDFPHFARVYRAVNALVREPEDVATLVLGLARDLAPRAPATWSCRSPRTPTTWSACPCARSPRPSTWPPAAH